MGSPILRFHNKWSLTFKEMLVSPKYPVHNSIVVCRSYSWHKEAYLALFGLSSLHLVASQAAPEQIFLKKIMYFTYFCAIILFCLDCNNNIEAFILTEISPHLSSYFWKKIKSTYKVSWSVCIELNFSQKLSEKQKKFRRHGSFIFIQTIQTEWGRTTAEKRSHTNPYFFHYDSARRLMLSGWTFPKTTPISMQSNLMIDTSKYPIVEFMIRKQ